MKFLFSLFLFFGVGLAAWDAQAMKRLGDIDEERKNASHIFPDGFHKDPQTFMNEKVLKEILKPGRVALQQGLYTGKVIQADELFLYSSQALHLDSQLGSNPYIELLLSQPKHNGPVEHQKWRFKVTVTSTAEGAILVTPETYTFSISLYPYKEMIGLSDKEKGQFNKVLKSERELSKGRLPGAPEVVKGTLTAMLKSPLSSPSAVSRTSSMDDYNLKSVPSSKSPEVTRDGLLSSSQPVIVTRTRSLSDVLKFLHLGSSKIEEDDESQKSAPLTSSGKEEDHSSSERQFKKRVSEWKKTKEEALKNKGVVKNDL
jgi:hypothetical protein